MPCAWRLLVLATLVLAEDPWGRPSGSTLRPAYLPAAGRPNFLRRSPPPPHSVLSEEGALPPLPLSFLETRASVGAGALVGARSGALAGVNAGAGGGAGAGTGWRCKACQDVANTWRRTYGCAGTTTPDKQPRTNDDVSGCRVTSHCNQFKGKKKREMCTLLRADFAKDDLALATIAENAKGEPPVNAYDTCVTLQKCQDKGDAQNGQKCYSALHGDNCQDDIFCKGQADCSNECFVCYWVVTTWPVFSAECDKWVSNKGGSRRRRRRRLLGHAGAASEELLRAMDDDPRPLTVALLEKRLLRQWAAKHGYNGTAASVAAVAITAATPLATTAAPSVIASTLSTASAASSSIAPSPSNGAQATLFSLAPAPSPSASTSTYASSSSASHDPLLLSWWGDIASMGSVPVGGVASDRDVADVTASWAGVARRRRRRLLQEIDPHEYTKTAVTPSPGPFLQRGLFSPPLSIEYDKFPRDQVEGGKECFRLWNEFEVRTRPCLVVCVCVCVHGMCQCVNVCVCLCAGVLCARGSVHAVCSNM